MLTYVSCWTTDSSESIPMWMMYSKNMTGIRLELDSDMFLKKTDQNSIQVKNVDKIKYIKSEDVVGFTLNELEKIGMSSVSSIPRLVQVEYITEKTLEIIRGNIIKIEGEHSTNKTEKSESINTGIFGRYKLIDWAFQKEWRLILQLNPFTIQELHNFNLLVHETFKKSGKLLKMSDFIDEKIKKMIKYLNLCFYP